MYIHVFAASLPALRSLEFPHLSSAALRAAPPADDNNFPRPQFVTQQQDHFDSDNNRTWEQAFYVNAEHWDGTGPVFLCVGGEGPPLTGAAVVHSVHCNNAVEWLSEVKALMFAVEHRYYGCHNASACPYSPSDANPLQWLSSRQALADLAHFHAYASARWKLPEGTKWVSWGGSYPGMLASFVRVLYPNLIHASVASSAPVRAKLDMEEYYDIASRAYSLPYVGGGNTCEVAIRNGHAEIGALMNTSTGRDTLASMFPQVKARGGADWLKTRAGQARFAGNGVAAFPSQSNDPACTAFGCNIERICDVMVGGPPSPPVQRLATLAKGQAKEQERRRAVGHGRESTALASRASVVEMVAREQSGESSHPHLFLDYWGYQTCTEFGFYQTCEVGTRCFFTQGLNQLSDDDSFCQQEFSIPPSSIQQRIDATNAFYGAGRPDLARNASRILYVNGDVDPWSGLSILASPSPGLPTLQVPGASHHAWTHPSAPTDQTSVIMARTLIRKQVTQWLQEGR